LNLTYKLKDGPTPLNQAPADVWVMDDVPAIAETIYQNRRHFTVYTGGSTFPLMYHSIYEVFQHSGVATKAFTKTGTAPTVSTSADGVYTTITRSSGDTLSLGSYCTTDLDSTAGWLVAIASNSYTFYHPTTAFSNSAAASVITEAKTAMSSTVTWAPITLQEENELKMYREIEVLTGSKDVPYMSVSSSTELVTTTETQKVMAQLATRLSGALKERTALLEFNPFQVRLTVPQQHRRGQQLKVSLNILTAIGAWTVLGLSVDGEVVSKVVNK
jgi:hypothetical protein